MTPAADLLPGDSMANKRLRLAQVIQRDSPADGPAQQALRYAALSGLFNAHDALAAAGLDEVDPDDHDGMLASVAVTARLADACDTRLWQPKWIMRSAVRARMLAGIAGDIATIVAWRRALVIDGAAEELCQALLGEGDFRPDTCAALLASDDIDGTVCRKLIRGLTLGSPITPAVDLLEQARFALARIEARIDLESKLITSFVGRETELADLVASLEHQWQSRGGGALELAYVAGLGGVGKSTLLAKVREQARAGGATCVLLDFDRPGINGGDPLGLSRDVARQIAELLGPKGADLYPAIAAASAPTGTGSERAGGMTLELVRAVAQILAVNECRLLLSLDTLEALTVYGDNAIGELLGWLHLLKETLPRLAIMAAGREERPAFPEADSRSIVLRGLPDAAARAVLKDKVPPAAVEQILAMAKGNPLLLGLGAEALRVSPGGVVAELSPAATAEIQAAQLYRLILSRIEDPLVRKAAHPGLLLRWIDAEILAEVVFPTAGLEPLPPEVAQRLIRELARHAWLVDERDGRLGQRAELRALLLELQIAENSTLAQRLFAAGAEWHAARGEAQAALYYRLQDMRWNESATALDGDHAGALEIATIEELPQAARDAVARARGERSSTLRAAAPQPPPEVTRTTLARASAAVAIAPIPSRSAVARRKQPRAFDAQAAAELTMLVARRNHAEAAAMIARVDDLRGFVGDDTQDAAVIEALWRGGDWHRTRWLLSRRIEKLDRASFAESPNEILAAMRASLAPERFRRTLRLNPDWGRKIAGFAAKAAGDSSWEVAELLLRAEGFATAPGGFADLVFAQWCTGAPGRQAATEVVEAKPVPACDPHHALMLRTRLGEMDGNGQVRIAPLAVATLFSMGVAADDVAATPGVGTYAVEHVDRLGMLAPFATVLAVAEPKLDLAGLADAAVRRAATVRGYWGYGDLPEGWHYQAVDPLLATALTRLRGTSPARQALARWREGSADAGIAAFPELVDKAEVIARRIVAASSNLDLPAIARRLAEAGVPIPLIAPLAVLSRSLPPTAASGGPPKGPPMASPPHASAYFAEESRARLAGMPADMRAAARRAIEKGLIDPARFDLRQDALESPLEAVDNPVALEAIVLMTGRPPMLVKNDRIVIDAIAQNAMGPGTGLPMLNSGVIAGIEGVLPSIGRIEFINHRMQWGGTGFVIPGGSGDRRRLVTNRHVAKLIAQRVRDGSGVFLRSPAGVPYRAKIDLREEYESEASTRFECPVERIIYIADDTEADCALFEIVVTADCKPGEIRLADNRARPGELVATIGYPAYDDRNEAGPMHQYFGEIFNVKRFAPGLVTQSNPGDLLMHDCTTLGGNSGSPLISLTQQAIVGLHFSGKFGEGNSAVSVETLKQLQTGRLFALTEAVPSLDETPADGEHSAAELANREGYDPDFLGAGLAVPPPEIEAALQADLARPSDATPARPHELRYTHFGVWYSKSRKQPRFTAVNIDGEQSRRIKRAPDIWFRDLRIAREIQLGKADFAGDFDRGHMVRREDPNFGPQAQQANDDTFHYTNCALQHSSLNRGITLWQGLENYILSSARTEGFRACVFTGPILADDDLPLGIGDILVPREFWKIVAMPKAGGGLHATGYLLSQGDLIRKLLEQRAGTARGGNEAAAEGFVLGEYRTFQVSIRNLQQATGLTFAGLAAADPLAAHAHEAISPVTYAPLDSLEGVILAPPGVQP